MVEPILFGYNIARKKVLIGFGRISAVMKSVDKNGNVLFNAKKYNVAELDKSDDYKVWK